MSKTNIPNSTANLLDNDTRYEVVPRRRSDRRSENPPKGSESEGRDIKVQKMDAKDVDLSNEDERRQSDRRTSRPTLLSVDEIAILRKK